MQTRKDSDISMFELHALRHLATLKERETSYPSAVGFALQEHCDPTTRKPNPTPQGMALFAGKFLRVLRERGLVSAYKGWSITRAGRQYLEKLDANP